MVKVRWGNEMLNKEDGVVEANLPSFLRDCPLIDRLFN